MNFDTNQFLFSSGTTSERQIVTTDLHHTCTVKHTGTSASAPMAAGIIALALEANPSLTWRDVQHLIVKTSQPRDLKATDWRTNGLNRKVSHSYGYGLMDTSAMVKLAKNWTLVPSQVRFLKIFEKQEILDIFSYFRKSVRLLLRIITKSYPP